jgi:hypothetical protein
MRKRGFGDDYSYSESSGSSSYNSAAVEDGDDSFVDSDVSDDYNSDSVDYSAYGSSSGELEGSDSSPSSEEDSSDDASARNCNGGSLHLCPHSASMNRYREIKHHASYIDDSSSESSKAP